jgi:hypothetical protein
MSVVASMLTSGAVRPKAPKSFVGMTQVANSSTTDTNLDISSLGLQSDDLLIVSYGQASNNNILSGMSFTGGATWTEVSSINVNESTQINHKVAYGRYDGTNTITFTKGSSSSGRSSSMQVIAFRGIKSVKVGIILYGPNSDDLTWQNVGTTRTGDFLVLSGHIASTSNVDWATIDYLTRFQKQRVNTTYDILSGQGYLEMTNDDVYNPSSWNSSGTASTSSESGVGLILT